MVAASATGLATGFAGFSFFASLFFAPLSASFGWSRSALAIGQSLTILGAIAAPLTGAAIDRFGMRPVVRILVPVYAATLLALAALPASLTLYYVLMGILTFSGAGTTAVVFLREVARQFDSSRGLALAASRLGVSAGGLLVPSLLFLTISQFGWRAGYGLLALLALGICFPAAMAVDRGNGGAPSPVSVSPTTRSSRRPPFSRLMIFYLALALAMGPVAALLGQLQPVLVSKQVDSALTPFAISLFAAAVAVGAVIVGILADRFWAPLIAFCFCSAAACGMILLWKLDHVDRAWGAPLACALVGLSQGAELDLSGYLIARYFGIERFARIFGLSIFMIALTTSVSAYAFGRVFDSFGSYDAALIGSAVALVAAGLQFLMMGRYPVARAISPNAPQL